MRTLKFRLKDSNSKRKCLSGMSKAVNFVWNYCNEASFNQLKKHSVWLNSGELQKLTSGVGKEINLNSQVIQGICKEFTLRRYHARKAKLSWRVSKGSRQSLGWIPCTNQNVKFEGDRVKFGKKTFKFWKSREIPENIRSVSFNEDSKGNWYVNVTCLINLEGSTGSQEIGIDLGLKTLASLSDGRKFNASRNTRKYEKRLAMAQRANKRRQVKAIHAKIKNSRKDWNHKVSNEILKDCKAVFVGNVSASKLAKTRLAKSIYDAGWSQLKSMLEYKAIPLSVDFREVNESYSTATCSDCLSRTGPRGLRQLSVREWTCSRCGAVHDRDTNAAKNILRVGHHTLIKGIPRL